MKFFQALKNAFEKEDEFNNRLKTGIDTAVTKIVDQVKFNASNLLAARENELISEYEFKLQQQKKEYECILVERDVTCEQYVRMINELQSRIEQCQIAYQKYFHSSLEIKRSSVEITDQMKKTLDENGVLWKGFARIRDNVEFLTNDMEKDDTKLRELLGMGASSKAIAYNINKKKGR